MQTFSRGLSYWLQQRDETELRTMRRGHMAFVKTNERVSTVSVSMQQIFRSDIDVQKPRLTQPYFTKYEYTTLLATRAQQIAEGAQPLVEVTGLKTSDPMFVWNVARREIEQRKLPFVIRRPLPNGESEFWSAQELEIIW